MILTKVISKCFPSPNLLNIEETIFRNNWCRNVLLDNMLDKIKFKGFYLLIYLFEAVQRYLTKKRPKTESRWAGPRVHTLEKGGLPGRTQEPLNVSGAAWVRQAWAGESCDAPGEGRTRVPAASGEQSCCSWCSGPVRAFNCLGREMWALLWK